MNRSVGIIGAGFGGLTAASLLAAQGFRVKVFEKNSGPGGKAGSILLEGFRFDTGPSFFSMPHVFEHIFSACGEEIGSYIDLVPLKEVTRHFYNDGTLITSTGTIEGFAEAVSSKTTDSYDSVYRYLSLCAEINKAIEPVFLWRDPREAGLLFTKEGRNALSRTPFFAFTSSMDSMTRKYLRDEKSVQIFNRYATFNGSSPYRAKGVFNLIAALELEAKHPRGGIFAVPRALEKLALNKGVHIRYNTPVDSVLTEKKRATGIKAGGIEHRFNHVVLNTDIRLAYERLLPEKKSSFMRSYNKREDSTSGIVFYWGINRTFSKLGLHNILFSDTYREEFNLLFSKEGSQMSSDPTVYINISSKMDHKDAPAGMENWFVLVNAPCDKGQNWKKLVQDVRKAVIKKCSALLGTDLESCIIAEQVLTPKDIEEETGSYRGSLYGLSSNKWNSAFLRPANRAREFDRLYFCGGTVHPGGGMPLAVLSGRQAALEVMKHDR